MLAFLIALVACILQARKASAARLVGSVLFAAFAAVIIAAVSEQLEITERARNRFASITNVEDGSRIGRLLHWQDSFWAGLRYLPMGAGLGAHPLGGTRTRAQGTPDFAWTGFGSEPTTS